MSSRVWTLQLTGVDIASPPCPGLHTSCSSSTLLSSLGRWGLHRLSPHSLYKPTFMACLRVCIHCCLSLSCSPWLSAFTAGSRASSWGGGGGRRIMTSLAPEHGQPMQSCLVNDAARTAHHGAVTWSSPTIPTRGGCILPPLNVLQPVNRPHDGFHASLQSLQPFHWSRGLANHCCPCHQEEGVNLQQSSL